MTEAIMRRLAISGAEIEATVEMVRQHMVCQKKHLDVGLTISTVRFNFRPLRIATAD